MLKYLLENTTSKLIAILLKKISDIFSEIKLKNNTTLNIIRKISFFSVKKTSTKKKLSK